MYQHKVCSSSKQRYTCYNWIYLPVKVLKIFPPIIYVKIVLLTSDQRSQETWNNIAFIQLCTSDHLSLSDLSNGVQFRDIYLAPGNCESYVVFTRPGSNFTNSVQGVNFKNICRIKNQDILQNLQEWSGFSEFMPCAGLVKLYLGLKILFAHNTQWSERDSNLQPQWAILSWHIFSNLINAEII